MWGTGALHGGPCRLARYTSAMQAAGRCRQQASRSRALHGPPRAGPGCRRRSRRPGGRGRLHCAAGGAASNGADPEAKPFFITTPLYYVNAKPHMGSAYSTIAADVIARYQRLRGRRVAFVTGTDEHGEKIALAAAAQGLQPQEHCDAVAQQYTDLWSLLDIRWDSFIRTTDAKHEGTVRAVLERVWERGDIYKADYEGWYCVGCEAYKDEGEMTGDRECPTHRTRCQQRREANYFFALSKYQQQIQDLLEGQPDFVAPAARRNEVRGWVKAGLRDFSISRQAVAWGFPFPRDPGQTVYVWFDALLGYASALLQGGEAATPEALAARGWPADVHVVGKDILRFHAVYWPAMLLSAGLPLPRRIFAHGFLTKDGQKMGKALGNVLEPRALVEAYGADAVRLYFMREIVFGQDGDFEEGRFQDNVNATLANTLGNLLNRTLSLLAKHCGGALPADSGSGLSADLPLRAFAEQQVAAVAAAYDGLRIHEAAEGALALAAKGNEYMDASAPWTAFKKGGEEEKAAAALVLLALLEACRITAVLLSPITPALSARIYAQLGLPPGAYEALSWGDAAWGGLRGGQQTPKPAPVFARIERDFVTQPVAART